MIPAGDLVILDTNILIHLLRSDSCGTEIERQFSLTSRISRPLISLMTRGEILAFAKKCNWGDRKLTSLDALLQHLVIVNPQQGSIVQTYASIDHYSEKVCKPARPLGQNDMWIAATAAETKAWLLTTDGDFDHLTPNFIRRIKCDSHTGSEIARS